MTASTAVTGEPSEPAEFVIERAGVVGLGHMGYGFAVNRVEDGHEVLVYDRDPKRTAALSGARAAAELADLASCDVAVTSLPDDDALAAVALGPDGLAAILPPPAIPIFPSPLTPAVSPPLAAGPAPRPHGY